MNPQEPKVRLTDLISLRELQEMQDSFSEVASVAVRTIDASGQFVTKMSLVPALCSESFTGKAASDEICSRCLPTFLGGEGIVDEDLSYECIPGLKQYLLPLKIALTRETSLIAGYMVIGPVIFMKRREKNAYAEIAEKLNIDLDQLWSLILELRVFSYKGIRSFLDMVENLMGRILNLAYAKRLMQDEMAKGSLEARDIVSGADVTIDEFIALFLDLVMDMTNGNAGSVMLLDRVSGSLKIRAAHGLPADVVRSANVPLGRGVSGLAAQTKTPFLINENTADPMVGEWLHKPQLFSSVVVPIKYGEDVFGVVNVSSDRNLCVKFDDSTLALVSRAAGVAGVALQKFQN